MARPSLIGRLKQGWRELRRGEPGRRFRSRYERKRRSGRSGAVRKCCMIIGGLVVVLAGIVLLPLPGPGMVIVAIGALLMAEESSMTAKALDRLELRARALVARVRPSSRRPQPRSGSR